MRNPAALKLVVLGAVSLKEPPMVYELPNFWLNE